jgi:hypothetical protein
LARVSLRADQHALFAGFSGADVHFGGLPSRRFLDLESRIGADDGQFGEAS